MHDEWIKHRDSNRFFRNMQTIVVSGVALNLKEELAFVTMTAGARHMHMAHAHAHCYIQLPASASCQLLPLPISFVTMTAVFIVVANCFITGYTDFEGVRHAALLPFFPGPLALPPFPFSISLPALSLLLGG